MSPDDRGCALHLAMTAIQAEAESEMTYMQKLLGVTLFLATLLVPVVAQPTSILIVNGRVIDGTGAKGKSVAIRMVGDLITEIGKLTPTPADRVIDARGNVVAPGFIDIHNHSETGLVPELTADCQI